jgi:hypothetical protein
MIQGASGTASPGGVDLGAFAEAAFEAVGASDTQRVRHTHTTFGNRGHQLGLIYQLTHIWQDRRKRTGAE